MHAAVGTTHGTRLQQTTRSFIKGVAGCESTTSVYRRIRSDTPSPNRYSRGTVQFHLPTPLGVEAYRAQDTFDARNSLLAGVEGSGGLLGGNGRYCPGVPVTGIGVVVAVRFRVPAGFRAEASINR